MEESRHATAKLEINTENDLVHACSFICRSDTYTKMKIRLETWDNLYLKKIFDLTRDNQLGEEFKTRVYMFKHKFFVEISEKIKKIFLFLV